MNPTSNDVSGQPPAASVRGRRLADRVATVLIAGGGSSVILAILLIFLFVGHEALPLARGSRLGETRPVAPPGGEAALLVGTDSYQNLVWRLDGSGRLEIHDRVRGGAPVEEAIELEDGERLSACSIDGGVRADRFVLGTSEGRLLRGRLLVRRLLDGTPPASVARLVQEEIPAIVPADSAGPIERLAWARGDDREVLAWTVGGLLRLAAYDPDDEEWTPLEAPAELAGVAWSRLAAAPSADRIALATAAGEIAVLDLEDEPRLLARFDSGLEGLRDLVFFVGGGRLAAGDAAGRVLGFFEGRSAAGAPEWLPGPALGRHSAPVARLLASPRDRSLLSLDEGGGAELHFATTGRRLLKATFAAGSATTAFSPRADALLVDGPAGLGRAALDNPHPEISWRALFGAVHYEGYGKPAAIWQSTGGSDEFEAKLGVLPLIFGTLKGTFYALLFSVPLSLMAAIYVSRFAPVRLARTVKPAIEIMAALPSVIIGFLAGLVFAPWLETHLTGILAFLLILPALLLVTLPPLLRLPALRAETSGAAQLAIGAALIAFALVLGLAAAPWLDAQVFGGRLIDWLQRQGTVYDQRNSLVVGFALGFAVIPIIFTMAEDALSNVPDSLVSASLALGASRWTTVVRVVLPGAAAGVFAAIMIGLGRAIGETMIVLMATGNTPLMDISPFNGFRALSACIAVEIPEAPVGGTLYRVLFLLALLLFLFTFAINTGASWIGERLRKRHGRL